MTTALQSFASLIRAAGHQRRLMVLWLDDRYFLERGGTLVHAVDTHVIVLYVQPDRSVTLEHWEGYAEMFPDDDRFLSQALEGALARHIFYSLEHDQPLLVLPPMEQEIGRVFNAINRHVHSEQVKARDELKVSSQWCARRLARVRRETALNDRQVIALTVLGSQPPRARIQSQAAIRLEPVEEPGGREFKRRSHR